MHLGTGRRREQFVSVEGEISTDQYREYWDTTPMFPAPNTEILRYLRFLPPLEAEIFWLTVEKRKNQKHIAELLGLSQSTVSYRCRRAVDKLTYLAAMTAIDVKAMLEQCTFLKPKEREVLTDLFYTAHQDLTGRKFGIRQSSVKWIFIKTKRRLGAMERVDQRWSNHLGMMLLLERNLGVRVHCEN